jgi:nucleoside-diphosphate-sugar epimerase
LIIRAGDFFGPLAGNNWFSEALVKPGQAATVITYPGRSGVGHQWAYVPDVAETVVRLLETSKTLDHFAVFQLKSHWDDCTQMIEAICKAAGNPNIKFARGLIQMLAPFAVVSGEHGNAISLEPADPDRQQMPQGGTRCRAALILDVASIGLGCLQDEARPRAGL